jgi:hypothetical protein
MGIPRVCYVQWQDVTVLLLLFLSPWDGHEKGNRSSGHNFLICLSLPRIFCEILS